MNWVQLAGQVLAFLDTPAGQAILDEIGSLLAGEPALAAHFQTHVDRVLPARQVTPPRPS